MSDAPRGSPVKGMVFGLLVDIGGSFVATIVLLFVWTIWLSASGVDAEGVAETIAEPGSTIAIATYTTGGAFSWLGGYICARVARETELRCAAVIGAISALISLVMGSSLPLGLDVFLAAMTFGCVMLGGWMGQQHNERGLTPP